MTDRRRGVEASQSVAYGGFLMAVARTTLRRRSGDIVTAIQLADRTGIVAASAPPVAGVPERRDLSPATVVLVSPAARRSATRRLRRNLLFASAAALFLVVGWIGGGTFGHGVTTPSIATGAITDKAQPDADDAPPDAPGEPANPTPAPVPITPAKASPSAKREASSPTAKRVSRKEQSSTATSEPPPARDDLVDQATSSAENPLDTVAGRLQQFINAWASAGVQDYQGYGVQSARRFAP
jgi:hypothetical protein